MLFTREQVLVENATLHHGRQMDRIYRYQRHFYDATRPLFLPGRDLLLRAISPLPGERVLEIGCGTARNLICLARRYGAVHLYGIDISRAMLKTAATKVRQAHFEERIHLCQGSAEALDWPASLFPVDSFDHIFFSYSLSMMPEWKRALDAASTASSPTGSVYAVDFWDLLRWPRPVARLASRWLSLFHVHCGNEVPDGFRCCFPDSTLRPLWGRYAFLALPAKKEKK